MIPIFQGHGIRPIIEDAMLGNDLDCQNFDILNITHMYPVPDGLVDIKDPRLYDPRVPPFHSVTNESVDDNAAIDQSKLKLEDNIPATWLTDGVAFISGTTQAARGNKAEFVSAKGALNGYAALDSGGKVLSSHITAGGSAGTVNSVGLLGPRTFFFLAGTNPITTSGTFSVTLTPAPDQSWVGVNGSGDFDGNLFPNYLLDPIPVSLVPSLSATKVASGTFTVERMPSAVGMGVGHASGILPDTGKSGNPTDYIGRDMQWHQFGARSYQPSAPKPSITLISWSEDGSTALIQISVDLKGATLFYRVTDPVVMGFVLAPFSISENITIQVSTNNGFYVEAYTARTGYNNSEINSYTVVTPPSGA